MKLLVLDGNSILNRAFYGIKLLSTKDGQFTNAIYGFMTTFMKILEESQPNAVAIAFETNANLSGTALFLFGTQKRSLRDNSRFFVRRVAA